MPRASERAVENGVAELADVYARHTATADGRERRDAAFARRLELAAAAALKAARAPLRRQMTLLESRIDRLAARIDTLARREAPAARPPAGRRRPTGRR